MKDLYSAHASSEDMEKYYREVKDAYLRIFERLSLKVKVVEASGGVFTKAHSHEFQVLSKVGEDTIYYCNTCDFSQNEEIFEKKEGEVCPKCKKGVVIKANSIEVGNIFPLGTVYSEKMGFYFTDTDASKKPVVLASYGIGPTRILGTLVEVFHDDKGIIWPKSVAPYQVHLISIQNNEEADRVYESLLAENVEVLYDDRKIGAGEKFNDADLIGIPVRLVVSAKTYEKGGKIEWKERKNGKTELLEFEEVLKRLKKDQIP